jgi:hypothetical protein
MSEHPLIANSVFNSARFPHNFCYNILINHLKHSSIKPILVEIEKGAHKTLDIYVLKKRLRNPER